MRRLQTIFRIRERPTQIQVGCSSSSSSSSSSICSTTTSGNSVLSIVEASESLEIDLGPIRFDEVLNAVRKLKNAKASGPEDISAEMLKSHNGIAEWLWDIVNKCWTEENLPQDWKLAEVVPLYKSKGKRSECGNYRGISLLSVPGKVFASIILNRCKDSLDQVLREEQCGFRKSRGQLFALRQTLEKCMAFQLDVSFFSLISALHLIRWTAR